MRSKTYDSEHSNLVAGWVNR